MSSKHAVVVTGSAGGLGAAAAERFAVAGYRVFGLDRAASGATTKAGVHHLDVDVCSDTDVRDAFAEISAEAEVVGLVHCAGIAAFGPNNPGHLLSPETGDLLDNLATIERTLRTNLLGSFTVVRHAAAAMARRAPAEDSGRGFVVLTSSGAALDGKAGQSAYSASKSGVIGMTLPLARELGRFGIRVVTIAPGLFDTAILDETPQLPRHVPFPARMGEPHEFAALAHHIAENTYINGEVIRIDGGSRGGFESPTPFIK